MHTEFESVGDRTAPAYNGVQSGGWIPTSVGMTEFANSLGVCQALSGAGPHARGTVGVFHEMLREVLISRIE